LLNEFTMTYLVEDKFLYSEVADFAIEHVISQSKKVFPGYEIKGISYPGVIKLATIIRLN